MKSNKEHKFLNWLFTDGLPLIYTICGCVGVCIVRPEWWIESIIAGIAFVVPVYTMAGIDRYIDYRKAKKEKGKETKE